MKTVFDKYIQVCPKTGRVKKIVMPGGWYRILFPVIGLAALLWILIRVVPKPSRAEYPCVKAATPVATGFLVYLLALAASALGYWKTRKRMFVVPYLVLFVAIIYGFRSFTSPNTGADVVLQNSLHVANAPIGEGKGIFPGRVVWVYDPNATNQKCIPNRVGHGWWMPENNDQAVIDRMVGKAIQSLTGQSNNADAWDAIFKYHNATRGKGSVGYKAGEKFFIKINNTSGWGGNFSTKDLSVIANNSYGISETSPEMVLAVLRQLVNVVGVKQSDISVGDPMRNTYKHCYEMWHNEFPDVHYMSHDSYPALGREKFTASTTAKIFYSDKGTVLRENVWDAFRPGGAAVYNDFFYTIYEEAEYLINLPMLKGHKRAGITMFAKNHFGSHTRGDASHLHNGLVDPQETPNKLGVSRTEYGMYRVQVDLMGHKLLGRKSLVYLLDALWAADQEISYPKKFTMPPFNTDWMSSVFASLDPVAIESVGYDFLRSEFTASRNIGDGAGTYPQKPAADDYLHQAADTTLWAAGIKYDPDNTGLHLQSLGTHEHWNNLTDKQYSRDLGVNTGIELVKLLNNTDVAREAVLASSYTLSQNYPNPFNHSTKISYSVPAISRVTVKVYDITGREVATLEDGDRAAGTYMVSFDASQLASGVYFYKLTANEFTSTKSFTFLK